MARLEASILINKTAADIFAFLNVPENHAKFIPGMLEYKQTSPGPFGRVGSTTHGLRRFLGQKMELPYEITEYQPNNKFGMKGSMGPLTFKDGYVLDSLGATTRVKFWLELTLSGLMKVANPFLALVGMTHAQETLANLKKTIETTS